MKNPNLTCVSDNLGGRGYVIIKDTGISVKSQNMMHWDHSARTTKDVVFLAHNLVRDDGRNLIFRKEDGDELWFLKINKTA